MLIAAAVAVSYFVSHVLEGVVGNGIMVTSPDSIGFSNWLSNTKVCFDDIVLFFIILH